jgi:Na+/melibiose symporter-like transporter
MMYIALMALTIIFSITSTVGIYATVYGATHEYPAPCVVMCALMSAVVIALTVATALAII